MRQFINNLFLYNIHSNFPHYISFFVVAILSIFAGLIIGWDRERLNKPAGFRTFALVALGATTFTLMSVLIEGGDPTRIISQVVTGIGFIGAGAVFKAGKAIKGLTTAAGIWVTAAMGCIFGLGYIFLGVSISFLILVLLVAYSLFEMKTLGKCTNVSTTINFKENGGKHQLILEEILFEKGLDHENFRFEKSENDSTLIIRHCDRHANHKQFLFEFSKLDFVREVNLPSI